MNFKTIIVFSHYIFKLFFFASHYFSSPGTEWHKHWTLCYWPTVLWNSLFFPFYYSDWKIFINLSQVHRLSSSFCYWVPQVSILFIAFFSSKILWFLRYQLIVDCITDTLDNMLLNKFFNPMECIYIYGSAGNQSGWVQTIGSNMPSVGDSSYVS